MKRFENGARVCFVGDSITCANVTLSHVVSFYRRNFQNEKIKFFNCGVSGGALINCINTYDFDIALYNPTHIVLAIGVNDSCHTELEKESSPERYAVLEDAYNNYAKSLARFYDMVKERGAELILCTPAPYMEYQKNANNPLRGGSALMLGYANLVRDFARENGLPLCDYHYEMTKAAQSEILFNADCVHPIERGYEKMAEIFLKFQGLEFDKKPIEDGLCEWREVTRKLRSIKTFEYLAMPNEQHLHTSEERFEKIKSHSSDIEAFNPHMAGFLRENLENYLKNKPHENEYQGFVIDFMEK